MLDTTGEPPLGEPVAAELDAEAGNRHPDRNLVEPDLVGAVCADSVVGSRREDAAHRERVASDAEDDRDRKREDAQPELGTAAQQATRVVDATGHDLEVEAGAELSLAAQEHDRLRRRFRHGERVVQAVQHGEGEGVGLAVVQADDGDVLLVDESHGISHARTVQGAGVP